MAGEKAVVGLDHAVAHQLPAILILIKPPVKPKVVVVGAVAVAAVKMLAVAVSPLQINATTVVSPAVQNKERIVLEP